MPSLAAGVDGSASGRFDNLNTRVNAWWAIAVIVGLAPFARRGIKDWGTMIRGHGGMLDRLDSACLSAPVFLHVVRLGWGD